MATEERLKDLRIRGRVDARDGVYYDTTTLSRQEREAYFAGYHGVQPTHYPAIEGMLKDEDKKSSPVDDFVKKEKRLLLFCLGMLTISAAVGADISPWAGVAVLGAGFIFMSVLPFGSD